MPITERGYKPQPPSDEELMRMQAGARLKSLLPELEASVEKSKKRIVTQVEQAIAGGNLTGDRAVAFWYEYTAHSNVLRTMQNDARLGEAAGEKLAALINKGE